MARAQECLNETEGKNPKLRAAVVLSYLMNDSFVEEAGMWSDLLASAYDQINWREIAYTFLRDLDKLTDYSNNIG